MMAHMAMTPPPTALILRTAGINCDRELVHAFELAGATARLEHLHRLIDEPALLEQADLIGVPGGFSYGDDIAAGRIFANRLRHRLLEPLRAAVRRGVPMIGVCNGFQVLVKAGLLPFPLEHQAGQVVTLADNTHGRFVDRWVRLNVPADTVCVWTRGLDALELPIAHGEGRFAPAADTLLQRLREAGQIALRYAGDDNPNGSADDIAGICDPTGLVLGLMPHPERFVDAVQHPHWTRWSAQRLLDTPAGLAMFQRAVAHVREHAVTHQAVDATA
jgi:phosphoribosylformylglycinamidine synthase